MALITSANAREMAARSHAAKAARLEALRQAANPPPPETLDSYTARRIGRVRAQIEMINLQIDRTLMKGDGKGLRELTHALARLTSVERQLAEPPTDRLTDGPPSPPSFCPIPEPLD